MFEQLMVVREQILGARDASRLPAHLLYSDRDFNENDYDALLALDDTVPSRKGCTLLTVIASATLTHDRVSAPISAHVGIAGGHSVGAPNLAYCICLMS